MIHAERTPLTAAERMLSTLERRRPSSAENQKPSASEKTTPSGKEIRTPATTSERRTPSTSAERMEPDREWPVPGGKDHPLFGTVYSACVLAAMLFLYAYFSAFARYYDAFLGGKPL